MKVLVVEDNPGLLTNVTTFLAQEGVVCEGVSTFEEGMEKVYAYEYDLLLLDIMLPDGNGLDLLREVRQKQSKLGVLVISAKDSVEDKINGLDLGADDYLAKPFHLSELNARLKAIYRRKHLAGNHVLAFDLITVDTDTREAKVNEQLLDLTKKEYDLLLYLLANQGRVLTKQTIAEHLWGDYMDTQDSFDFVYQHIKNLRKKITQAGGPDYITTLYGTGYKFTKPS